MASQTVHVLMMYSIHSKPRWFSHLKPHLVNRGWWCCCITSCFILHSIWITTIHRAVKQTQKISSNGPIHIETTKQKVMCMPVVFICNCNVPCLFLSCPILSCHVCVGSMLCLNYDVKYPYFTQNKSQFECGSLCTVALIYLTLNTLSLKYYKWYKNSGPGTIRTLGKNILRMQNTLQKISPS